MMSPLVLLLSAAIAAASFTPTTRLPSHTVTPTGRARVARSTPLPAAPPHALTTSLQGVHLFAAACALTPHLNGGANDAAVAKIWEAYESAAVVTHLYAHAPLRASPQPSALSPTTFF